MITAVTTAIASVLLILVGLPLVAWWLGGRRFWSRLQPGRGADPWGDFVRRHRLSAAEQFQVQQAVGRGRALEDDRLRRAVVDLAEVTSAQLRLSWTGGSRAQRVLLLLALLWVVLLVTNVVAALASSGFSDVPWFGIVSIVAVVGTPLWQRRTLRRAIELNREPAA
jgi:hypothetical protein